MCDYTKPSCPPNEFPWSMNNFGVTSCSNSSEDSVFTHFTRFDMLAPGPWQSASANVISPLYNNNTEEKKKSLAQYSFKE